MSQPEDYLRWIGRELEKWRQLPPDTVYRAPARRSDGFTQPNIKSEIDEIMDNHNPDRSEGE